MSTADPRQQVRDLIAARITDKLNEWGVGEPFPEDELADAVMELFPEIARVVRAEFGELQTYFMLLTASEPIEAKP